MNIKGRNDLKLEQVETIKKICKSFPKEIEGYLFEEILIRSLLKECRESQLHSFDDKTDGYCESLHEYFAGNSVFVEPVLNYVSNTFLPRRKNFSLIKEIFKPGIAKKSPFLQFPVFDFMPFFQNGKLKGVPHTIETIKRDSKIPSYEMWKKITLEIFPNGMELLTRQKEFQKEL